MFVAYFSNMILKTQVCVFVPLCRKIRILNSCLDKEAVSLERS